ncbi:MAG: triose-phosphate isomerase [Candidatus Moranbacteria bacterium]|nr:triose-phosphate isomerase [Candidatus Moranbacteria bacterium]NTW46387.1 triose-phosphate isomerase [Candidatus Moranbacteria bacterium]
MKRRYLIGNLKMNLASVAETEQYLVALRKELFGKRIDGVEIVLAPSSVYLERFSRELPDPLRLAAQDVFWEKEGSFTGQVSAPMLRDLHVGSVIVGHGERRLYAHETDTEVGWKMKSALHENLQPILCVGETADERERGEEVSVVSDQVRLAFHDVSPMMAERVLVAYEPRWAIGTDIIPESEQIFEMRIVIHRALAELYGQPVADRVPVLYGGSVKATLLERVCFEPRMDGVLVGRESLYPHELFRMAHEIGNRDDGRREADGNEVGGE